MDHPQLAIIDPNTLSMKGLSLTMRSIVEDVDVCCFNSFGELVADTPDMFFHYFVASGVFFEHTEFFLERRKRTIVLVTQDTPSLSGMRTLNVSLKEHDLVCRLLDLYKVRHQMGHPGQMASLQNNAALLTHRETQVLSLVARGLKNRQIAQKLHISESTVITHRKNLTRKLGIKSSSALAVWAVLQGIVEADAL